MIPTFNDPENLEDTIDQWDDESLPWRIDDEGGAEWAARKWRAARDELDRIEAHAATWRDEIDAWEQDAKKRPERSLMFFHAHLVDFARRTLDEGRKSLKLPSGTLWSRTPSKPRIVPGDPEAVLAWAKETGREVTETVKPAVVSDAVVVEDGRCVDSETGEMLPESVAVAVLPETTYGVRP